MAKANETRSAVRYKTIDIIPKMIRPTDLKDEHVLQGMRVKHACKYFHLCDGMT